MGILDEAIREHLELKRQHGADDSELKQLEDDAFGPPRRPGSDPSPDPAAEAPTEFMSQPGLDDGGEEAPAVEAPAPEAQPSSRREPVESFIDLQEAPELERPVAAEDEEPAADEPEEPAATELEEPAAEDDERPLGTPNVEDQPAAEHEAVLEIPSGPNTEERHAIADQPTEMFDVQKEFEAEEDAGTADLPAPPDEDLVAEEIAEPRLAPAPDPIDQDDEDDEDDFFDQQRLSDELDQALEAPIEDDEDDAELEAAAEPEAEEEAESAEHELTDRTEIHEVVDRTEIHKVVEKPSDEDHDALEETPDFLEESPDDDQLWFEQKPPKDFDFDD
jgi:hypothetical protein